MSEGSAPDNRFSKARLEMLCDGIFAIAMTLLVLELKVPELPKDTPVPEIWHALREHGLSFFGFALTFLLAGQIWISHHRLFQYLRGANRALAMLSIPFLMFVSLLPFSTSMLTAYGPRHPVALTFYIGNQFVLSALLAAQWLVARRSGLLAGVDADADHRFARFITLQPISLLIALVFVHISPRYALLAVLVSWIVLNAVTQRIQKARAARASAR